MFGAAGENRLSIAATGAVHVLIALLGSPSEGVQWAAVGAIQILFVDDNGVSKMT